MRQYKFASALLMTMILVGCGGSASDVPAKPKFTAQVSFGDSLSDVGSYRVATIGSTATNYVGQFTINAAPGTPTNWTQMTAAKLGLPQPCAAAVGGFGIARNPAAGISTVGCYGYSQGGARVSNAAGVGNVGAGGPMTEPVTTQIANHLTAIANQFSGNEVVFVMAGANDVFTQAGLYGAGAISLTAATTAVQAAAGELAIAVKTQIIANGAKYVVVVNVPDIASTPQVTSLTEPAKTGNTQLFTALVSAFNTQLKTDLPDSAVVLNVDAYTASKDEVVNKAKYLLDDVTSKACPASSLTCNATNLNSGVTSKYLFADAVHPTPYGHLLFATYVLQAMTNKGWY